MCMKFVPYVYRQPKETRNKFVSEHYIIIIIFVCPVAAPVDGEIWFLYYS
jgi:hypothetical protein